MIADGITTHYGITNNLGQEINPVGNYFFETFGLISGILIIKTIGAILYWIITQIKLDKYTQTLIYSVLITEHLIAVMGNLQVISN
jgi:hypothetical protein